MERNGTQAIHPILQYNSKVIQNDAREDTGRTKPNRNLHVDIDEMFRNIKDKYPPALLKQFLEMLEQAEPIENVLGVCLKIGLQIKQSQDYTTNSQEEHIIELHKEGSLMKCVQEEDEVVEDLNMSNMADLKDTKQRNVMGVQEEDEVVEDLNMSYMADLKDTKQKKVGSDDDNVVNLKERRRTRSKAKPKEEIWLPEKNIIILFPLLCKVHRRRLSGENFNGWLDSEIIDRSMAQIRLQYPQISGLASCKMAPDFTPVSGRALQIVNTAPHPGEHWILLEIINVNNNYKEVTIYDSGNSEGSSSGKVSNIPTGHVHNSIQALVGGEYCARRMRCPMQTNNRDCGVYSVANMIARSNDMVLSQVEYMESTEMRKHLENCLNTSNLTVFPHRHSDPSMAQT